MRKIFIIKIAPFKLKFNGYYLTHLHPPEYSSTNLKTFQLNIPIPFHKNTQQHLHPYNKMRSTDFSDSATLIFFTFLDLLLADRLSSHDSLFIIKTDIKIFPFIVTLFANEKRTSRIKKRNKKNSENLHT